MGLCAQLKKFADGLEAPGRWFSPASSLLRNLCSDNKVVVLLNETIREGNSPLGVTVSPQPPTLLHGSPEHRCSPAPRSRPPSARPFFTPSCHQICFAKTGQFRVVLPENKSLFQSFIAFHLSHVTLNTCSLALRRLIK